MAEEDGRHFEGSHEGHARAHARARGLIATDVTIRKKAFSRYATGLIENTSGQQFSYLVVRIDLFDVNGRFAGNVGDGVQNLRPGQTWNFEAGLSSEEAATAKVSEIKGWL
jgi:hypothetical protein